MYSHYKITSIGKDESKNIGISDIGKNPISCIPNIYIPRIISWRKKNITDAQQGNA